ncbi:MAG: polynucleotide adenylyltransferase [Chloroflexi bacterium]|nr:polynucleotide adenylyltransferase [Chloroflexota bacterium]
MILAAPAAREAAIASAIGTARPILDALMRVGGTPYLVGGAVRDALLGEASHDLDVEVHGLTSDAIEAALAPLGRIVSAGRSYRVMKLYRHGSQAEPLDIAPAPAGQGIAASLARRDFTWNALALCPNGEIIDPYRGIDDMRARLIRHVSPAFDDDPLRVLRAMRFAARYGLRLCAATVARGRALLPEAVKLPGSRIWGEWDRWASTTPTPSAGLRVLVETGWLAAYPELQHLEHPEWRRLVGRRCDAAADLAQQLGLDPVRRSTVLFAMLLIDSDGAPPAEQRATSLLAHIGAPHDRIDPIAALCHVGTAAVPADPLALARLAARLAPANIQLWALARAAAGRRSHAALGLATRHGIADQPAAALVRGCDLIAAGVKPGPALGDLLAAAYEAQLDGAFSSRAAGIVWAQARIN